MEYNTAVTLTPRLLLMNDDIEEQYYRKGVTGEQRDFILGSVNVPQEEPWSGTYDVSYYTCSRYIGAERNSEEHDQNVSIVIIRCPKTSPEEKVYGHVCPESVEC